MNNEIEFITKIRKNDKPNKKLFTVTQLYGRNINSIKESIVYSDLYVWVKDIEDTLAKTGIMDHKLRSIIHDTWGRTKNEGWRGSVEMSLNLSESYITVFATVERREECWDDDEEQIDIVVGSDDMLNQKVYLNVNKRLIRVQGSLIDQYAYHRSPLYLLKDGGVL